MKGVRLSRWLNAHFGSGRNEMYSSYAYRENRKKTVCVIDFVSYVFFNVVKHCRECYLWEKKGKEMEYPERPECDFSKTVQCVKCDRPILREVVRLHEGKPHCLECLNRILEGGGQDSDQLSLL